MNEAGDDLVPGKIHTIRQNYEYWKRFEGREVALSVWDGKPRQKGSKQITFCVKRIYYVDSIIAENRHYPWRKSGIDCIQFEDNDGRERMIHYFSELVKNDGFENSAEFWNWFSRHRPGKMAILHFTDFRY